MLPSTLRASRASALRAFGRAARPVQRNASSLSPSASFFSPSCSFAPASIVLSNRATVSSRSGLTVDSLRAVTTCRCFSVSSTTAETAAADAAITDHPDNNVSPGIAARIGTNLHLKEHHPLNNIKHIIETHFNELSAATGQRPFKVFDDLTPIVTKAQNFDELLIPDDHVSRSPSDTFYVDGERLLRCHTSAHQNELLRQGNESFLCTGDVYRRDTVDASHYPVFHQMEGVKLFNIRDLPEGRAAAVAAVEEDLKTSLEGMARALFGDVEMRWVDAYFPFTDPSMELEIFFNDEWLEVLGSGVMQQQILDQTGHNDKIGWAFGLGLERLAMVLYNIPDIRLFWSNDSRFLNQFQRGQPTQFKPFSNYPPCLKDVAFWVPEGFHENDFHDAVRSTCQDLVEDVQLVDEFEDKKNNRVSHCYRLMFRSMERNLVNEEIDKLQFALRDELSRRGYNLR